MPIPRPPSMTPTDPAERQRRAEENLAKIEASRERRLRAEGQVEVDAPFERPFQAPEKAPQAVSMSSAGPEPAGGPIHNGPSLRGVAVPPGKSLVNPALGPLPSLEKPVEAAEPAEKGSSERVVKLLVYLPEALRRDFKVFCASRGVSMSQAIIGMMKKELLTP